jgi:hypothetical protein
MSSRNSRCVGAIGPSRGVAHGGCGRRGAGSVPATTADGGSPHVSLLGRRRPAVMAKTWPGRWMQANTMLSSALTVGTVTRQVWAAMSTTMPGWRTGRRSWMGGMETRRTRRAEQRDHPPVCVRVEAADWAYAARREPEFDQGSHGCACRSCGRCGAAASLDDRRGSQPPPVGGHRARISRCWLRWPIALADPRPPSRRHDHRSTSCGPPQGHRPRTPGPTEPFRRGAGFLHPFSAWTERHARQPSAAG